MKISKEVKVGILAVVALVLFYLGLNFLKGVDFFSPNKTYFTVYNDIDGLNVSNPVLINGLTVGRVSNIEIIQDRNNAIRVELDVDKDLNLGSSTVALLTDSDFLGSKAVELRINYADTDYIPEGSEIRGELKKSVVDMVRESTLPVVQKVDTTITNINLVLGNFVENRDAITHVFENLEAVSADLRLITSENRTELAEVMSNMSQLSASLSDEKDGIGPLLRKMNLLADSLNNLEITATVMEAKKSMIELNALLSQMNEGEGTLGKLAKDDQFYTNMTATLADLDKLLIDLRENPKRYVHFSVFGRKTDDGVEIDENQE